MISDLPEDVAIRVRDLGKGYDLSAASHRSKSLRDDLVNLLTLKQFGRRRGERFSALRDISFDIKTGECVGVIGANAAGKSTLLKLLCRITLPDTGWFAMRGSVASILEVGTGFHPGLSGRENIYLNGTLLGLTRVEINERYEDIVAFAGIGEYIHEPVKRYSSGMYVRLAFSIAAHVDPDVLIIDEVLAVGDEDFQRKCLLLMKRFTSRKDRTLFFVSHDLEAVESVCTRCLFLSGGSLCYDGDTRSAIERYRQSLS